jgi:hypothetical protein
MKWRMTTFFVLAVGCGATDDSGSAECSIDGLTDLASATMDGDTWPSNHSTNLWNRTGSGIQITLQFAETQRAMTIRGNHGSNGVSIVEGIDSGEFPINVSLDGADGTGSIIDSRFGEVYASNQPGGSGSLTILDVQGSTMSACFSFVAANDDGVLMEVSNGMAEVDERD